MKSRIALICFAFFYAQNSVHGFYWQDVDKKPEEKEANKKEKAADFSLSNVKYFHRYSKDDLHEFTPAGQDNLDAWTDMATINNYPKVQDDKALADVANTVLEKYKQAGGKILRTDSIPKTKDRLAEHLAVVVFGRPEFIEVAFARFRMHDGKGMSLVYSHRAYGKDVSKEISTWLEKNGPDSEKNLMKWDSMPKLPESK